MPKRAKSASANSPPAKGLAGPKGPDAFDAEPPPSKPAVYISHERKWWETWWGTSIILTVTGVAAAIIAPQIMERPGKSALPGDSPSAEKSVQTEKAPSETKPEHPSEGAKPRLTDKAVQKKPVDRNVIHPDEVAPKPNFASAPKHDVQLPSPTYMARTYPPPALGMPELAGTTGPATTNPGPRTGPRANAPAPSKVPVAKSTPTQLKSGSTLQKRPNGKVSNIHDAKRGIDVHHNLNGSTRVTKTLPNHSQVVAVRGGPGYVQHTYTHNGHSYAARTYVYNGRTYNRYYNVYPYRGVYLNVYAPGFYYSPYFYGWAYGPWGAPVYYSWGWAGNPWYGYYGFYFAPSPFYPSASLWLTDYMISSDLSVAYTEQQAEPDAPADQPAASGTPALTSGVKEMIAAEVKSQIDLEKQEATQNAQNQDPDPSTSGIAGLLSDHKTHVFVVGSPLDVVDTSGAECALSDGDVLNMVAPAVPDATSVNVVVLTSKGSRECAKSATVTVALTDLQDMQNHMRESIDQGLKELQSKQGQGGLPAAPPSAMTPGTNSTVTKEAPAPEINVSTEVNQQLADASQAEKEGLTQAQQEAVSASPAPAASSPAGPVTINVGQTIEEVTASLGAPLTVLDLGAKKIYKYENMRVIFKNGKVTDVE